VRNIDKLIIHCSATPEAMDIGESEINQWHKQRGWSSIGYHYVIRRSGKLERGRDIGRAGAHARGYNKDSIGICLIGGVDENSKSCDNYTISQKRKLQQLLNFLVITFPSSEVLGHRDVKGVRKSCPCFDVREWYYGQN